MVAIKIYNREILFLTIDGKVCTCPPDNYLSRLKRKGLDIPLRSKTVQPLLKVLSFQEQNGKLPRFTFQHIHYVCTVDGTFTYVEPTSKKTGQNMYPLLTVTFVGNEIYLLTIYK